MSAPAVALAAALTATAVALLVPPRPTGPAGRRGRARRGRLALPALAGVAVAVVASADPTRAALVAVVAGALLSGARLTSRRRQRHRARARADVAVEQIEALASELRSGRPALPALRHCAGQWPALDAAARAAELGGDVPQAWRELAGEPGAEALAQVAAAWQVSESTGAAMAPTLDRVARTARDARAVDRTVETELATATATARLVAALPVVVLVTATGLGGDPWRFLLATPAGLVCLGVGVVLAHLGLSWVERIAQGVRET